MLSTATPHTLALLPSEIHFKLLSFPGIALQEPFPPLAGIRTSGRFPTTASRFRILHRQKVHNGAYAPSGIMFRHRPVHFGLFAPLAFALRRRPSALRDVLRQQPRASGSFIVRKLTTGHSRHQGACFGAGPVRFGFVSPSRFALRDVFRHRLFPMAETAPM